MNIRSDKVRPCLMSFAISEGFVIHSFFSTAKNASLYINFVILENYLRNFITKEQSGLSKAFIKSNATIYPSMSSYLQYP